jgi:hypothetical protein
MRDHEHNDVRWGLEGPQNPRARAAATAVTFTADGLRLEQPAGAWRTVVEPPAGPTPPWQHDDER